MGRILEYLVRKTKYEHMIFGSRPPVRYVKEVKPQACILYEQGWGSVRVKFRVGVMIRVIGYR